VSHPDVVNRVYVLKIFSNIENVLTDYFANESCIPASVNNDPNTLAILKAIKVKYF